MAKGQQRSNREAKKPKQDKPKKLPTGGSNVNAAFNPRPPAKPKSGGK